jgi:SAM-dependent methyltransferase
MRIFKSYAKFYDLIYKDKEYDEETQWLYAWAGYPKTTIDLGCGTGRHHKLWGGDVIGIDQSKEMLSKLKNKEDRLYLQSNIEEDIIFKHSYCYTALFNVIGYCNLENIISQMKQPKGGIFIFDVWDANKFKKVGFNEKIKSFEWGEVIIYPLCNEFNEWILKIVVKLKRGRPIVEYHNVLPYSYFYIKKLCKKYGYNCIRKDTDSWTTWYKLIKK